MTDEHPFKPFLPDEQLKPMVLVVDDDPVMHKLIRYMSNEMDIAPYIVSCAEDAVEAVSHCKFDLILLDWSMPGADGGTCAKKIREIEKESNKSHTPIVAVTAHAFPDVEEKCYRAGMDDFLSKPFTMEELYSKLKRWIAHL